MKRVVVIVFLLSVFASILLRDIAVSEEIVIADFVIENVKVFTVDKVNEEAEAIAIKDEKFVYVGDKEGVQAYKGPKTEVMYLDNQLLLPGLIDAHIHAYLKAEELYCLDLSPYSTFGDYKQAILKYRNNHPRLVQICATGWDEHVTTEASDTSGLTPRELIDEIVPDKPFLAISNRRQELWVNSKVLQEIEGEDEWEHAVYIDGIIRGYPMITKVMQVLPQPDFTVEQYKLALLEFQKDAAKYGITAAFVPFQYISENLLEAFESLDKNGQLTLTYELGLYVDRLKGIEQIETLKELREKYQGENYSINSVKVYSTTSTFGGISEEEFAWNQEKFNETLALLDEAGFRIHIHANGESLEEIFKGFEYAAEQNGKRNFEHSITHLPFVTREDLVQFRKFKLVPSTQPSTFYRTYGIEDEEKLKNLNRMKSYFEKGLPVTSSSDYPFEEMNPFYGIESGMTRLDPNETDEQLTALWPKEKATLKQMLRSYTIYPARQIGQEEAVGKIRVGKQADFIVLDQNLFKIPPNQISETQVVLTYFKGKEIYRHESLVEKE